MKIIIVDISHDDGSVSVDLSGFHGKGTHAIQEAFAKAFGHKLSGNKKEPSGEEGDGMLKSRTWCVLKDALF
jgi:hypothetical protein